MIKQLALAALIMSISSSVSTDAWDGWGRYEATGYSHGCILPKPDKHGRVIEHGPRKGANNKWPIPNVTIAADPSVPFGTKIELSYRGIPQVWVVGDRGRAIKGRKIDLFMENCNQAKRWGRRVIYGKVVAMPSKS